MKTKQYKVPNMEIIFENGFFLIEKCMFKIKTKNALWKHSTCFYVKFHHNQIIQIVSFLENLIKHQNILFSFLWDFTLILRMSNWRKVTFFIPVFFLIQSCILNKCCAGDPLNFLFKTSFKFLTENFKGKF